MDSRRWIDAAVILALASAYWWSSSRLVHSAPYGYDEADYMSAASMGFRANWLDSPSISIGEFFRSGTGATRGGSRTALSTSIRSRGDVLFYRHWHGPLYYYWMVAAAPRFGHDEAAMHRFALIFPALAFVLVYCGLRTLIPRGQGQVAALLFGFLYLFSYSNVRTASMLGPHSLFVLLCLAVALSLAKLAATGRLAYWWAAVGSAALAAATLEIGVILVPVLAAVCWIERGGAFAGWRLRRWLRFSALSLALFLGVLTAVWPAAIFKLSILKAVLFMTYLAVFRRSAWGDVGFFESWWNRLAGSPIEWLLVLAGLAVFVRYRRDLRVAAPALVLAGLMLAAVLRVVSADYRYMSVYFPALQLAAAIALARALAGWRPVAAGALLVAACLALLWNSERHFSLEARSPGSNAWAPISFVKNGNLGAKRMLVPQGAVPVLHFYFPRAVLRGYETEREATAIAAHGGFDGILSLGSQPRYESAICEPGRGPCEKAAREGAL